MSANQSPNHPTSASPASFVDVVGAAIVDDARLPTRVLAARRAPGERHAGRWELPGGKVDPGESLAAALRREILEELGTDIRLVERLDGPLPEGWWLLSAPGASTAYRMAVWVVTVEDDPRPVEGHDLLRWLGPGELDNVDWLDGDLPVIAALARRLWG
ncbi:MAG: (deoxy)nucleoside triphosphate pyrophosphohydrolase [Dermatophilaceae bacterium]|nr:NUDIX domain-containing protein [Intrasporangiaceae bacterium]